MGTLVIDGARGEGGGQVLRSSLALALVTGRACRIDNIRAGRSKPGLLRQHLTAVRAAAEIGRARVTGAGLGSRSVGFAPTAVEPGDHTFAVGSAGSATLVLQTVLPALITASGPSRLVLEGGTHNPFAPPFDFLARAFLPLIERLGPRLEATLERPGFYPAGGGRFTVTIEPTLRLRPLDLSERGEVRGRWARATVSRLPPSIAERELEVVRRRLGWPAEDLSAEVLEPRLGPGNVLALVVDSEHVTEVVTGFGQRGIPAETVAGRTVAEAERYLAAGVPVGEHLADQLLLPLALAGGGTFRTLTPSRHTRTNIDVIRRFLEVDIHLEEEGEDVWRVTVGGSGSGSGPSRATAGPLRPLPP